MSTQQISENVFSEMPANSTVSDQRRPPEPAGGGKKQRGLVTGRIAKRKKPKPKQAKADSKSRVQCAHCGKKCISDTALTRHVQLKHFMGAAGVHPEQVSKQGIPKEAVELDQQRFSQKTPRPLAAAKPIYLRTPETASTYSAQQPQYIATFPPWNGPAGGEHGRYLQNAWLESTLLPPNTSNTVTRCGSGESLATVPHTPSSGGVLGRVPTKGFGDTCQDIPIRWSNPDPPEYLGIVAKRSYDSPMSPQASRDFYTDRPQPFSPSLKSLYYGPNRRPWAEQAQMADSFAYTEARVSEQYSYVKLPMEGTRQAPSPLKFSISSILGYE